MTSRGATWSAQPTPRRSRSSLEAAARIAERASKRTGRPVSERARQLLEEQQDG